MYTAKPRSTASRIFYSYRRIKDSARSCLCILYSGSLPQYSSWLCMVKSGPVISLSWEIVTSLNSTITSRDANYVRGVGQGCTRQGCMGATFSTEPMQPPTHPTLALCIMGDMQMRSPGETRTVWGEMRPSLTTHNLPLSRLE